MKLFGRCPNGFRIGRFEFYLIISEKGPSYTLTMDRDAPCKCKFIAFGILGATYLGDSCYKIFKEF